MAMDNESAGFLSKALEYGYGIVAAGGGVIWTMLTSRIKEVKQTADAALPRTEFDKFMESVERNRVERRDIEMKLFDKVDTMKSDVHEKFDELKTLILQQKK